MIFQSSTRNYKSIRKYDFMANIQFPFPLNGFVTSFQNVRYQRHFPKRQLPKSVLSAALGPPIVACGDSEGKFWKNWKMPLGKNLTFGKVSLGKLDIWEGATWSPLGKTFFFRKECRLETNATV